MKKLINTSALVIGMAASGDVFGLAEIDRKQNAAIKSYKSDLGALKVEIDSLKIELKKSNSKLWKFTKKVNSQKVMKAQTGPKMSEEDLAAKEFLEKEIIYMKKQHYALIEAIKVGVAPDEMTEKKKGVERKIASLEREREQIIKGEGRTKTLKKIIALSGAVEVSYRSAKNYAGENTENINVDKVAFAVTAKMANALSADITLTSKESARNFILDTAFVKKGLGPIDFVFGLTALPFGVYESNFVSNPISKDLGDTSNTIAQLSTSKNGFAGKVYVFNGSENKIRANDRVHDFGAKVNYSKVVADVAFGVEVSYISDFSETGGVATNLIGGANTQLKRVGGYAAAFKLEVSGFNFIGEYITAADEYDSADMLFQSKGAKPSVYHIEAGYTFTAFKKKMTAALGYQTSKQMVALGFDKERYLTGLNIALNDNSSLNFEYLHKIDYQSNKCAGATCGTDQKGNAVTIQWIIGF